MGDVQSVIYNIAQSLPGFLLGIVVHEWAHARVALFYGDDTAERSGRLTFNPGAHYDPIGTVVFPLLGVALGGVAFGWAKPVPVNTSNFKRFRQGLFWVSFAGPLSNFIMGTVFAFIWAMMVHYIPTTFAFKEILLGMLYYAVVINFVLGSFNLIPLPPLDGSKMISSFLKGDALIKYESLARYTPMIFLVIIFLSFNGVSTIGRVITPFVSFGRYLMMWFSYQLM
jgi:Zn-dependent protease